jgi:hypothetical protein
MRKRERERELSGKVRIDHSMYLVEMIEIYII